MRVALVSEHASPLAALGGADAGGQNVHVAALAAALAARGHDVVVHTRRESPDQPARQPAPDGYEVSHLTAGPPAPLPKDDLLEHVPQLATELEAALLVDRPDVVHAHFWMSGIAALAAAPSRTPVVQTFHALGSVKRRHQGLTDTSPHERVDSERVLARTCSRVIASCRDERAEIQRLGAPANCVDVVPSGVDLALFSPDGPVADRSLRQRIGVITRLVPRKGVDDTIRALAQLPETELVVAGGPADGFDGDEEVCRLRALAEELGVADRVTLRGPVTHDDVAALLRSCDAVACLPWYEPFGMVAVEAMACGRPVVASSVGGLLDTVEDGVTGFHVPARDPDAAAAALRRLLDDPPGARRMGRAGAERALDYGWDRIAERVERSYLAATASAREAVG